MKDATAARRRYIALNELIFKHDLTSRQIAEICGVAPGTVAAWRSFAPTTSDISPRHLARLQDVFATSTRSHDQQP